HMAALKSVEHALAAGGPPLNLRFLVEGVEEISGRSLPEYLRANGSRLASDWVLVWDGGFSPAGRPALVTGLRGILYVELQACGGEGEEDFAPVERMWTRPTLEVSGFVGGFTGKGEKTVIAAKGSAKVSMRLVPDQDPGEVLAALRSYVEKLTTPGVRVDVEHLGSAPPVLAGADHDGASALAAAFAAACGQPTVRVRAGGSIPVTVDFQEAVGAPLMVSGLTQPGGGAH